MRQAPQSALVMAHARWREVMSGGDFARRFLSAHAAARQRRGVSKKQAYAQCVSRDLRVSSKSLRRISEMTSGACRRKMIKRKGLRRAQKYNMRVYVRRVTTYRHRLLLLPVLARPEEDRQRRGTAMQCVKMRGVPRRAARSAWI